MWLRGLGQSNTTTPDTSSSDWLTQLAQLAAQGLQVYNQQQVLNYNLSQLQQGKPGLSTSQLNTLLQQTTPGVQVGLSSSTQNFATVALVGVGAVALLYMLTKSSRGV